MNDVSQWLADVALALAYWKEFPIERERRLLLAPSGIVYRKERKL
jgi:hypothetical protein